MNTNSQHIVEFTLIYNQHKTRLYNYVLKMIYDRMTCDDIIQNTFVKLYENLERIKNKESVKFWLFTTVRNEVYTYFRGKKIKIDQHCVLDSDEIDVASNDCPQENYDLLEMRELVMNELNKMAVEQRDVYLLKEYGELSYKEIAELMNIGEDLVKSRLHKTRQKLIKKIAPMIK